MAGHRRLNTKAKMIAAVVGGGAMMALGVAGAISGGSGPAAPAVVSAPKMTMGDTATADYTETSVQTSMAVPADKAKPYGGSGG